MCRGARVIQPSGLLQGGDLTSIIGVRPSSVGPVATLGPETTDADYVARSISDCVTLCESFPLAMAYAEEHRILALICAGFVGGDGSSAELNWVGLHFGHSGTMELCEVWAQPTKPMCLALHCEIGDVGSVRTVALHPSTATFARNLVPDAEQFHYAAKPLAVQGAAMGAADACIGSVDVVKGYSTLRAVEMIQAEMVWCLYRPRTGLNE